jgi:hypothetical protein
MPAEMESQIYPNCRPLSQIDVSPGPSVSRIDGHPGPRVPQCDVLHKEIETCTLVSLSTMTLSALHSCCIHITAHSKTWTFTGPQHKRINVGRKKIM